jgi:hypothetical protein
LAQDVFLPSADLQGDPVFTLTEAFVDDPLAPVDISAQELAQSEGALASEKDNALAGRVPQQDYDEFFDSAPLPSHAFESLDSQNQSNENKS